jgi:hypothetical protein
MSLPRAIDKAELCQSGSSFILKERHNMGKISKALEKSKKEQELLQKDPFRSFKNHPVDTPPPKNIHNKNRSGLNSPTTRDSNFGSIHTLLDDSAKMRTADRFRRSSIDKVQNPEKINSVRKDPKPDTNAKIKQERETDVSLSVNKKNEPPRPSKDERGNRRRPTDIFDKEITGLDFQPTPITKLTTIRALLDDSTKKEAIESCTQPSKEKGQAAEKVRSGRKDPTLEPSNDTK